MENEPYFTSIHGEYQRAVAASAEGYANIAAELDALLAGRVVDFGNGGVIRYDVARLRNLTCVDIINPEVPREDGNITFMKGDFYDFEFPAGTDVVLVQFLLHHLADDQRLAAALRRLERALGATGRLVVVEALMPRWMEVVQHVLRGPINLALRALRKPGLRFFSADSLGRLLEEAGFSPRALRPVDVGARMAPASALFPRLTIPGRLYPMRWVVVEAVPGRAHGAGGPLPG